VQVIVLDPMQDIVRHAQQAFGPRVVPVTSVHGLDMPIGGSTVDDVLIARVRRDEEGVRLAEYLRHREFLGRTFIIVDRGDQLGIETRLKLPRTESLQFATTVLETVRSRLNGALAAFSRPRNLPTFFGLVGRSKQILDVFARVEKAAAGDANVCIYGESGTGKELIARAIHAMSDRHHGPLVTFDCTAVPEGLAESQLFGHVRGAFTGAIEHREGVFAQADGGTLFIDELCELSMPLQAKLLRVVQGREFVKVGGTKPIRTNIRLVTATNKDPKQAVDAGTFRADLYYRVAVVMIKVPALRERREDIPLLVEHFLARFSAAYKKPIRGVQPSAMQRMMDLPWPGNIRQLENFLAQAVVLVEGDMLTERDLFVDDAPISPSPSGGVETLEFEPGLPLREVERRHILRTLQQVDGNRTEAARRLEISVRCLQYKLKAYAQSAETGQRERPAPAITNHTALLHARNVALGTSAVPALDICGPA
jgi:transcriptional regulator with PAS, ATPase and Fis domain